jgi:hypothetical protein
MSVRDWFQRIFSPAPVSGSAEDEAILREEYGENTGGPPAPGIVAGGASGLAGLESAEAAEDALEATEPPPDLAP